MMETEEITAMRRTYSRMKKDRLVQECILLKQLVLLWEGRHERLFPSNEIGDRKNFEAMRQHIGRRLNSVA
jgi:hypothetical protein